MKIGSLTAILIILIAAFVISFAVSKFVTFGPNGPELNTGAIFGSAGPGGCTVGVNCPTLAVTANPNSIYVNITSNANLPQSSVINATEPGSTCVANTKMLFQSDTPGWFSNGAQGTISNSYPFCYLPSGSCSCQVTFHSEATPGLATIVVTDITNQNTITPGTTTVTISWPATPCIGTATPCSNSGVFSTATLCAAQNSCAWYNPTATYTGPSQGFCSGERSSCSNAHDPTACANVCWFGGSPMLTLLKKNEGGDKTCGCTWHPSQPNQAALYPMCAGTVNYDCSQLNTISSCANDFRCQWSSTSNSCTKKSCSTWNSASTTCNQALGCVYTSTPCFGAVASCDSLKEAGSCQKQNGCTWASFDPNNPPCHSVTGVSYFNSTACNVINDQTTCTGQQGCYWTDQTSLCTGISNATSTCNAITSAALCYQNDACFYNFTAGTSGLCQQKPCSTWNGNQTFCNPVNNCTYNQVLTCAGSSASCGLFYNDQTKCQEQNGCQWYNTNPTTTTTTTSTTTTSSTSTTTTTPGPQIFTGSDFACTAITGGFSCSLNYTHNLGENGILAFLFKDSDGNVRSAPTSVVSPADSSNPGTAGALFYCSAFPAGQYTVSWIVWRQSDSALANRVAWSKSTEGQTISC